MLEIVNVKAKTVAEDPGEQGKRATLNLGHTLAHALEAFSQQRTENHILHGEAVAIGLWMATFLANELGLMEDDSLLAIDGILEKFGLSITLSQFKENLQIQNPLDLEVVDALFQSTFADKKADDGGVLVDSHGKPRNHRHE